MTTESSHPRARLTARSCAASGGHARIGVFDRCPKQLETTIRMAANLAAVVAWVLGGRVAGQLPSQEAVRRKRV